MGSTQSISRSIQPIAVNFHKMVLVYKTFIWTNNNKNSRMTVDAILEAILKIYKMPINNYFMQKKDKTSIYTKYQT